MCGKRELYLCYVAPLTSSLSLPDRPFSGRLRDVSQPAVDRQPAEDPPRVAQLGKSGDRLLRPRVRQQGHLLHVRDSLRLAAAQTQHLLLQEAEDRVQRLEVRDRRLRCQAWRRVGQQLL